MLKNERDRGCNMVFYVRSVLVISALLVIVLFSIGCATRSPVAKELSSDQVRHFSPHAVLPQESIRLMSGSDLPVSLSSLELLPIEGKAQIPIALKGENAIFERSYISLDDQCRGIERARAEHNRRMEESGSRTLGPIEPEINYISRPANRSERFLEVQPDDTIIWIKSATDSSEGIRVVGQKAHLLAEREGPVLEVVRIERFPPASRVSAVVGGAFAPLSGLMSSEDRRANLHASGCTTEYLVGLQIDNTESSRTGRFALGVQPAELSLQVSVNNEHREIQLDDQGIGFVQLDYEHFDDKDRALALDLVVECYECRRTGRFADVDPDVLVSKTTFETNATESYEGARRRAISRLFEPPIDLEQISAIEEFDVTDPDEVNDLIEAMQRSGYSEEPRHSTFITFLGDRAKAQDSGRTPVYYRDQRIAERQRRMEERRREEKLREERHARDFPYIARFSCTAAGSTVHFVYCFVGPGSGSRNNTDLRLQRGQQVDIFRVPDLTRFENSVGDLRSDGVYLDLPSSFSIRMSNASAHGVLGLEIFRRSDGRRVYQDQTGRHGRIFFRR